MTDKTVEGVYPPAFNRFRDQITARHSVRTFKSSPERVTVQIRGDKQYATASLTYEQAIEFANAIIENANTLFGRQKQTDHEQELNGIRSVADRI